MAYERISHYWRQDKIEFMIRIRWHTMWRKHNLDPRKFPLAPRWNSVDTFIRDAQGLVGFDGEAMLNGKLTLVRLTDMGFFPDNVIYVNAARCPAASGKDVFLIADKHDEKTLIVNASNFSRYMGANPQSARRHFLKGEYNSAYEGLCLVKDFKPTAASVRPYIESGKYF